MLKCFTLLFCNYIFGIQKNYIQSVTPPTRFSYVITPGLLCGFLQLPQFGAGWRQENRKCAEFLTTPKRTTCIFRSLSTPVYGLGTQPKSEIDLFAINYPSSDREPNEFLSWCFRETCQICETGTTFDRCLRSLASPIRFTFNWEDPLNAVISPKSKWK